MKSENGNKKEVLDLRVRTKQFAIQIVRLFAQLPNKVEAQVIGKQLLRSVTSVGAHYREAQRARSTAEYISKIDVGLQELDETTYWLEILSDTGIVPLDNLKPCMIEANELLAILVTISKKAKTKNA